MGFFNIHFVAKHQKIEGGNFHFTKKISVPKKGERGALWGFSTSILSQNIKKLKWKNFYFTKKISQCRKKTERGTLWDFPTSILTQNSKKIERGDPLVSPGMVCYAENQETPFWFSSLGQMMQFGAIIFCRTLRNYFGQFVWIEKKVNCSV